MYQIEVDAQNILTNNYSAVVLFRLINKVVPLARRLGCTYGMAVKFSSLLVQFDCDNFVPSFPRSSIVDPNAPLTWTVSNVCQWLQSIDLTHLCDWFSEQDIDGPALLKIDFQELYDLEANVESAFQNSLPHFSSALARLRKTTSK